MSTVGIKLAGGLRETGEFVTFSRDALWAVRGTPRFASEVLRQTSLTLRRTMGLMIFLNICLGISIVNFSYFFLRSIGASDYVGVATGFATVYVCAPIMFGYVFVSKVCCGLVAEIGAMRIQQELDALDSVGVDPMRYVVAARIVAAMLFSLIAWAIAALAMSAGGYLQAVVILDGVSAAQFADVHWSVQTIGNQIYIMAIALVMSLVTALVACFYGMRASGGPAGVGAAVARSCVVNLVLVHMIAGWISVVVYGTNLTLPVGG
jgi:phospholipid/cholesterol/gamma-HCH transport system permease protein